MNGNFTIGHILLIIIGILVLVWVLNWLFPRPPTTVYPAIPVGPAVPRQAPGMAPRMALGIAPRMTPRPTPHQRPPQQPRPSAAVGPAVQPPDTPHVLYNFYTPSCPHCRNFAPAWNDAADRLKNNNAISIRAVDVSNPENENLAFYYNVTQLPTIILSTPDRNIEYTGDRSADDLHKFVVSNTTQ